ncbi:adenylate kinase [Candidatus Gracilibacteria bacterium]|nr:MAG: adenylate kinase [Candidatus Gracilibacteria bacterium]
MKDIILAGIQASGKGTQAQKLLEKYGNQIAYFETGNILRALMSNENVIGNYLRETVNSGRLVKDEIVIGLFKVFLETLDDKGLLGDGSLRRIGQTKGILDALLGRGRKPLVIQLEIPEEEVYKRLAQRKMCKNCGTIHSMLIDGEVEKCKKCGGELYVRADDADQSAIANRIAEYQKETVPALEYVASLGLLVKIDGMQTIDAIFAQIEQLLQN